MISISTADICFSTTKPVHYLFLTGCNWSNPRSAFALHKRCGETLCRTCDCLGLCVLGWFCMVMGSLGMANPK
jgi:hypothetical protein